VAAKVKILLHNKKVEPEHQPQRSSHAHKKSTLKEVENSSLASFAVNTAGCGLIAVTVFCGAQESIL
jgi:hypothetical protein